MRLASDETHHAHVEGLHEGRRPRVRVHVDLVRLVAAGEAGADALAAQGRQPHELGFRNEGKRRLPHRLSWICAAKINKKEWHFHCQTQKPNVYVRKASQIT